MSLAHRNGYANGLISHLTCLGLVVARTWIRFGINLAFIESMRLTDNGISSFIKLCITFEFFIVRPGARTNTLLTGRNSPIKAVSCRIDSIRVAIRTFVGGQVISRTWCALNAIFSRLRSGHKCTRSFFEKVFGIVLADTW